MAERLTEHNKTGWALKLNDPQNEFEAKQQLMSKFKLACEKLGKLEDIMEKYNCKVVEDLQKELSTNKLLHETIAELSKMVTKAENERDTWQKACELACKRICYMLDQEMQYHEHEKFNSKEYLKTEIDYFYQQAKKEGNDDK